MVRDTDFDLTLRSRLSEIDDALRDVPRLQDERTQIHLLLAVRSGDTSVIVPPTGYAEALQTMRPPLIAESRPETKTSKLLDHSLMMLRLAPDGILPFVSLYRGIPPDLMGKSRNAREHYRGILQRAGSRVGIDYENADSVRLTTGVTDRIEMS